MGKKSNDFCHLLQIFAIFWCWISVSEAQLFNIQSQISQVPTQCDSFSAHLVLRCVSPLIEYTRSSNHLGAPLPDPQLICQLYEEYLRCTPESIRRACAHFIRSVESVYDYVCSDEIQRNFTQSYRCLALQERTLVVANCERNTTEKLRQVALALDKSENERIGMQCEAIREYLDCTKDQFETECGEEGWFVKRELTLRSTAAGVANCSYADSDFVLDPVHPLCNKDGSCICRDGFYMSKNKTCVDFDECHESFGLCSQKCENTPGSFKCSCDERYYQLAEDKKTCVRKDRLGLLPREPVSIFFAHGQSIWNISEDGEKFQLLRAGLQKAAMIDVDVQEQRLYYVDIGANKIQRMRFEGAFPQTIQDLDVDGTEGIAVDWVARKLYSVRHTNMIVQELDGRYRKMLYRNVFKLPRALAIYPQIGYVYGTDWGQSPFIARAAMDGSHFQKIITEGLVWPNGLAIDIYSQKLFWADAFLDVVECSELDGSNRRVIIDEPGSVPHIFSMGVLDDLLYWTDWTYRGIVRSHKFTGDNVTVIAQAALLPYGIKISHPVVQPAAENPCEVEQRNCSQLCLLAPGNSSLSGNANLTSICACADGFRLLPDGKCASACSDSQIHCGDPDPKCISKRYRCDGAAHCKDRADEQDCGQRICLLTQFQCHDGKGCLIESQVCDGTAQCNDESDEKFC